METIALGNPSLTVALALAVGIIAQAVARHVGVPGIVVLLAIGVALGPDGLGIVEPQSLGGALHTLVGFSVAVILFEGGMSLNLHRLRREQRTIRQMVTLGAVVSFIGGTLVTRFLLDWRWSTAAFFGTLAMVTGPTVINPLLKRWKVERSVATVLEAEGILVDAIGAVCAAVALEVALSPTAETLRVGALFVGARLGFGFVFGLLGGGVLALLLRYRNLVPLGMENVFTLAAVFVIFQGANAIMGETGIVAVIAAGLVMGNVPTPVQRNLYEFKEQLTVMLIGMLFILLAADVRLEEVLRLGAAGGWVAALMVVLVRPLSVWIGTLGTELDRRQRVFMAWVGPRGIVAAAVASLFASELAASGRPGGEQLRAMVFLLIAVTVVLAGLTGGPAAMLLGLRRQSNFGWIVLGAHELARAFARALQEGGEPVVLIDTNPEACRAAEEGGFRIIHGNGLDERVLVRAEIETRAGVVALTRNDEVNLLFAAKARQEGKVRRLLVTLSSMREGVTPRMLAEVDARIWSGRPQNVELWLQRLQRNTAETWRLKLGNGRKSSAGSSWLADAALANVFVPLVYERSGKLQPVGSDSTFRAGDILTVLVSTERQEEARSALEEGGWRRG